jgi:hypothetical protein
VLFGTRQTRDVEVGVGDGRCRAVVHAVRCSTGAESAGSVGHVFRVSCTISFFTGNQREMDSALLERWSHVVRGMIDEPPPPRGSSRLPHASDRRLVSATSSLTLFRPHALRHATLSVSCKLPSTCWEASPTRPWGSEYEVCSFSCYVLSDFVQLEQIAYHVYLLSPKDMFKWSSVPTTDVRLPSL